jgi:hypothetical protein
VNGRVRTLLVTTVVGVVAVLGACSDEPITDSGRIVLSPPSGGADHMHAPGQGHADAGPIGDGTSAAAGGYRMTDVRLPAADGPGEVSFRILDETGRPVTDYVEEQTKLLHLYVVRADLVGFRHLHPELGDGGTWRARTDLGSPGEWRVLAEFTPGGADRPVVLGKALRVPGAWEPVPAPPGEEARTGDDGVVRVSVVGDGGEVGRDGRLRLGVSSLAGEPLALGSYLGTSGHLTGFALESQGFVHVHPYGAPEVTEDGTVLTFHTTFDKAAEYRMFLQVRVDGLLHQVAVTVPVS